MTDYDLLEVAKGGDGEAFEELVGAHRRELYVHCYRMLGSVQDAEDALQESLLAAWRGLSGFEGRSSIRTWLYRVTTNVCLRIGAKRQRRLLSSDYGPPRAATDNLGEPVTDAIWIEPLPDEHPAGEEADPVVSVQRRESVELAYVAALQHLPATQRAVLLVREVLGFSADETAMMLDTTRASINSALQRARSAVADRIPQRSQQDELALLRTDGVSDLVDAFVTAWEGADVDALLDLLTADVRFTMPPLPAWFDGRDEVGRFMAERVFATPWKLEPVGANGQPAFACYQDSGDGFLLGAVNVLSVREGSISWVAGFVDPAVRDNFEQNFFLRDR